MKLIKHLVTAGWLDVAGGVLFALALNYKQMSLYFALPFFACLLGKALRLPTWHVSIIEGSFTSFFVLTQYLLA